MSRFRFVFVFTSLLAFAGCDAAAMPDAPEAEQAAAPEPDPEVKPLDRAAKFVDYNKAIEENPDLEVVTNDINAGDPISAAAQGYFNAASKLHVQEIQRQAEMMKVMSDNQTYPTFEQLKAAWQGQTFKGLKSWQMYAYNAETGQVVILSDPELQEAGQIN